MNLYFFCPNCKMPSCATANKNNDFDLQSMLGKNASSDDFFLEIQNIWPKVPAPEIPESVPEPVRRVLLQAESNYFRPDHEDSAAIMYRKALEVGLKKISPDLDGTLARRIQKLSENGQLTQDLAQWANEIKNLGNDGAHEIESIDRSELQAMRGLVGMVLRYLFTLPEQVKTLRNRASETP